MIAPEGWMVNECENKIVKNYIIEKIGKQEDLKRRKVICTNLLHTENNVIQMDLAIIWIHISPRNLASRQFFVDRSKKTRFSSYYIVIENQFHP